MLQHHSDLFNPLSANLIKWSNTLKQFVGNLPKNCLSVFDHFVKSALKENIDLFLHHKRLTPDEIGNGAIFTCAGFSFALIWTKRSIFVFDSHSRNNQGFHIPKSEFHSIKELNLFIMKHYEKNYDSTSTLQNDIQYIKVKTSGPAAKNVLDSLKKAKEQTSRKKMCIKKIHFQCGKCW